MRNSLMAAITVSLAILSTPPAFADASNIGIASAKEIRSRAQLTDNEMQRASAGLKLYYAQNAAWPSSLAAVSAFYSGDFKTPFGTIRGNVSTTKYELYIDVANPDAETVAQLKVLASRNDGQYNAANKRLIYVIDPPQEAAITNSMLSRIPDTSGQGLNTMRTDIHMGGFNIDGLHNLSGQSANLNSATIGSISGNTANYATVNGTTVNGTTVTSVIINGQTANLTSASGSNLNYSQGNITNIKSDVVDVPSLISRTGTIAVNSEMSFKRNLHQDPGYSANMGFLTARSLKSTGGIETAGAGNFAGGITVGSSRFRVADSQGRLFYRNQDLDSRFLLKNQTAVNSDNLGGVSSGQYARKDLSNTFTVSQRFNKGLTAGGASSFDALSARRVDVTQDVHVARNVYASDVRISGNRWVSQIAGQAANAENLARHAINEVQALKRNSGSSPGRWRFTIHTKNGRCPSTGPLGQGMPSHMCFKGERLYQYQESSFHCTIKTSICQ